MDTTPAVNSSPALAAHLLGILLVVAAVAFTLSVKLPLVASYRMATILLLALMVYGKLKSRSCKERTQENEMLITASSALAGSALTCLSNRNEN